MLPIIIVVLLFAGLLALPSFWVQKVMRRYSEPGDRYPGSGGELARHLLDELHLPDVLAEVTDKGDHYDPVARAVRLSKANFHGKSLTAVTVAAGGAGVGGSLATES